MFDVISIVAIVLRIGRFDDFDDFYDYFDAFGGFFIDFDCNLAWALIDLMIYIEAISDAENASGRHIYPGHKRSLFDPKKGSELARNALPILFSDFIFYSILLYLILLCLLLSLVLLLLSLVFLLLSLMCWYVLFMGVCRLLGRLLWMFIRWLWTILLYALCCILFYYFKICSTFVWSILSCCNILYLFISLVLLLLSLMCWYVFYGCVSIA